jgi:hypothetical protein
VIAVSEQQTAPGSPPKPSAAIPPLQNFLYEGSGYNVPARFTTDFVLLHGEDWIKAERDWEDIVALTLDTDGVARDATGGQAIKQAVEAAVAFLLPYPQWPFCPICKLKGPSRTEGAGP